MILWFFFYGGEDENFVPDPNNPVAFHLRRVGNAEPLLVLQGGIGGGKGFKMSKDGSPVEISLSSGKVMPLGQGDLRMECWTHDQGRSRGQKYDWRCRITVPNGGLLQYTNEFPFLAPLDGYESSDEIKMLMDMGNEWRRNATRSYFLKLANGNYARMTVEVIAGGDHFFHLESYLLRSH